MLLLVQPLTLALAITLIYSLHPCEFIMSPSSLKPARGSLTQVQLGKRTCTDCFTDECEACAGTLLQLGCPMGMPMPVWGRDNKNATQCMECAALAKNKAAVLQACGGTSGGETLETMVPKACGA